MHLIFIEILLTSFHIRSIYNKLIRVDINKYKMLRQIQQAFSYQFSQFVKLTNLEGKYANVAKLELDNPKKKNALSISLLDQVFYFLILVRRYGQTNQ